MLDDGYVCFFQVVFGKVWGFEIRVIDFFWLVDGFEIFFFCVGWCGVCGLVFGLIKFVYFVEFSKIR